MKWVAVCMVTVLMGGCAFGVPVKQKFPAAPELLMQACESLKELGTDSVQLTELLKTLIENYGSYHQCAARTAAWQDWYREQRQIFDHANK